MMPNIRMPSMTRAVITGRRINISATFLVLLALGSRGGGSVEPWSCRLLELALCHSRHQPQLPVCYYLFSGRKPLRDDGLTVSAAIDGHPTCLDRHVWLDHKYELARLPILNRL